ncbi:MAG TPA: NAD(P)H-dependent oxidoreductase [Acidimicrobiales bacterium]|nr:NAD(P)H-dependent oxidoreductase [Acidimicrobiales bacterium]
MTPALLTVCGSLQRRSANRAVIDAATAVAAAEGAAVASFEGLADIPAFDPGRSDEPIAAVAGWRRAVAASDAVLVAAPEYAGAVAGAVKNAFDWLVTSGEMYRRPVAVLSAGTSGGEHARRMLAQTLTWQGAWVVADLGIAAPRTLSDEAGRLTDDATLAAVAAATRTLLAAPSLPDAEVAARAAEVVAALGIDAGHVAPAG